MLATKCKVLLKGKKLKDVLPEEIFLKEEKLEKEISRFKRSLIETKISLLRNNLIDYLPNSLIDKRNELTKEIYQELKRTLPEDRDFEFHFSLQKILDQISLQNLVIDNEELMSKIKDRKYVEYSQFKAKTHRLTTTKRSFPILTLKNDLKRFIKPNFYRFLSIDFKAYELNILQRFNNNLLREDPHEWNRLNIFGKEYTRSQCKTLFFSWLYGSTEEEVKKFEKALREAYNIDKIELRYDEQNQSIINLFDEQLRCEKRKAINYFVQSSASRNFLDRKIRIVDLLKDKKSFVAFSVHDQLVIDLHKDELDLVNSLKAEFENTSLGYFPSSVSLLKSLGEDK